MNTLTDEETLNITHEQEEILRHTLRNGRFYTDANDPDLVALCDLGLMEIISGGWNPRDRYFGITGKGRIKIKETNQ